MLSLVRVVWIDGRVVEGGALLRHCMKACAACRGFESLSIRFRRLGLCHGRLLAGCGVSYP